MHGGHARTEANPALRHSRVIHWCNPKTTPPQFVTEPIHTLTIGDDDGHHVRCRFSGVESQASKLRMEVIGVFPKLRTQLRLCGAELERLKIAKIAVHRVNALYNHQLASALVATQRGVK